MTKTLMALAVSLGLLAGCSKHQEEVKTPVNHDFNPNPDPVGSAPSPNLINHAQDAVNKIQIPQAPTDGSLPKDKNE